MKRSRFFTVCAVVAAGTALILGLPAGCTSGSPAEAGSGGAAVSGSDVRTVSGSDAVLANIFARKSVRKYLDKPVSADTLTLLAKAGMAAPSAMNRQPWEIVIFSDTVRMRELAEGLPYAKMLTGAGAAIVVLGNPEKSDLWYLDCAAVTQNILLAAEAMGLGAVWTAAYPYPERVEIVKKVLSVPDPYLPLCVIPIGYPQGTEQPKDKWKPEKVHYNQW